MNYIRYKCFYLHIRDDDDDAKDMQMIVKNIWN